ncbi:MAG: PadR family transcriptional regulator [Asgard group archaeon]|nr:PadR family transcriptional regulator [Asgard group archaeon]
MLKKVRTFHPNALIADLHYRGYVESFESELMRGISTVAILQIMKRFSDQGVYGYQLVKMLQDETNNVLIIDEGTLYPLLKKMEKDGVLVSERKNVDGRTRRYYNLTDDGKKLLNHMLGFFSKLLEAVAPLSDFEIKLPEDKYMFCPNCANKIKLEDLTKFCEICGYFVEELTNQGD